MNIHSFEPVELVRASNYVDSLKSDSEWLEMDPNTRIQLTRKVIRRAIRKMREKGRDYRPPYDFNTYLSRLGALIDEASS